MVREQKGAKKMRGRKPGKKWLKPGFYRFYYADSMPSMILGSALPWYAFGIV
jgi:hypothetical protein